jgi:WD repeat-containing protein 22
MGSNQHWLPTIYSLSDPYPVAICSGRNLPDGSPSPPDARTFSDSTTMKVRPSSSEQTLHHSRA